MTERGKAYLLDKRILKTKRALKESLIQLLEEKNFESVNTTEICKNALVSRNTFYNYYADKYALLEECFHDYEKMFLKRFDEKQTENNPEHDRKKGFLNLINTFLDTEQISDSKQIFSNFDLAALYYRAIMNILQQYEDRYQGFANPDYDFKQLNSFLIMGFWGFVHGNPKMDRETIRKNTQRLMMDLLDSPIFQADYHDNR